MPSVTTVLSATETEKSKAGLRTWQKNNPGMLEAASKRGSAIHLGCENYLRGLDPGVPEEYQDFWSGLTPYLDWFDTIHWSERPLQARLEPPPYLTIEKLHMSGAPSIYMLDALTSLEKSVV